MKKLLLLFSTFFCLTITSAQGIGAFLAHSTFNVPGQSPYAEIYLEIIGNTLVYKQLPSGGFQGSIQITMIIRQDTVIKDYKKYELLSTEVQDTTGVGVNFIDQQRFSLPNGNYTLELSIADKNVQKDPAILNYPFTIDFPADKPSVSTIQLVNSYTKSTQSNVLSKSGYDLVPLVDNFFPSEKDKLIFYGEIYNPLHAEGSDEKFLVSYYIESFENGRIFNEFARVKREPSKPVMVVLNEFDISRLPTGNYNLVVNLKDKNNLELATSSTFFQRSNPEMNSLANDFTTVDLTNSFVTSIIDADTLREYIRSFTPVATEMEKMFIQYQLASAPVNAMQQYFLKFWENRDPLNPKGAWETYNRQVRRVNAAFKTQVKKGYETDMGYVFLKYGEPNTIQDVPYDANQKNIPYQIWHYYSLNNGRERNKKFVFISSELTVRDYTLVHSDASGEIQNYNWQGMLRRELWLDDADYESMRKDRSRSGTIYNNPF
ncbi:MAG TPA: GWxTD domain-containing protein [Bacteroidales bacterium]|nr:GWxTD domain-containing protein [Bacteroidales bacterium]